MEKFLCRNAGIDSDSDLNQVKKVKVVVMK